jgi:hypothetical protein
MKRVGRSATARRIRGGLPSRRIAVAVAVAAAVVLSLTGCPGPGSPGSSSASPAATQATTPYTADQRALYRQGVRRVESFDAANQPILAAGSATREAKRLYQRWLWHWRKSWALLQRYQREGIRVARAPVVLSTEPVSIKDFQDSAAEVVLRRCTDQSDLGVTRDGTPLPPTYDEPVIQKVVVIRFENRSWHIDSSTTTGERCSG